MDGLAVREFEFLPGEALELADVDVDASSLSSSPNTRGPLEEIAPVCGLAATGNSHGSNVIAFPMERTRVAAVPTRPRVEWSDPRVHTTVGLGRLWSPSAAVLAVGVTSPLALMGIPVFGEVGQVVFWAALFGHAFRLVDHIGRGYRGMALPDDELDTFAGLWAVLFRAICCMAVVAGPVLVWCLGENIVPKLQLEVLWGLAGGALLGPAALTTVVHTRSGLSGFNPVAWAKVIRRCGRAYLTMATLFALLEVTSWVWWVAVLPECMVVPVFGPVAGGLVLVSLRLIQAIGVGEMLAAADHRGDGLRPRPPAGSPSKMVVLSSVASRPVLPQRG